MFGSRMGWERANYFASGEAERKIAYGLRRQNWFDTVAAEHRACREAVVLVDMTSFAKLELTGPDVEQALQHLCANDMAVPEGTSVYTALLNTRGGFESDVTAARLAPDRYLILTGSGQAVRDAHWIRRNMPTGTRAWLTDVTSAHAVLALMGPRSRQLLARLTAVPLDDAAFPLHAVKQVPVGYATCWAAWRSYMGEFRYELYVPTEFAACFYDALHEAGRDLGLQDAGYYAVESLRLEKGYRAWGRELSPDVTPYEAGLGFAVRLDKGDFIGRDALLTARKRPLTRRLVSLLGPAPDQQMAWGGEAILIGRRTFGEVTSASFGATLGGIVALGWVSRPDGNVDQAWLDGQDLAIDLAGERMPVRASVAPFYDHAGSRMRG